jgi:hypothetical protein
MAQLYTDIATNQQTGANFPGGAGGMTPSPSPGGFNDPVLELGSLSEVTAIYKMTGNELQNDIVNIVLLGQGATVNPTSNVAGNGVATTAQIQVGDTDTVGATVTADQGRYSAALNVAADNTATAPVNFAGGTVVVAPASITDDPVWVTAKFSTLTVPVAGKVLVFRIRLTWNR